MEEREKVVREAALGHEGSWKEVISKKRMKLKRKMDRIDIATNGRWSEAKDIISFFFTEFPDSHGAKAMLNAFLYYGDVTEVVIPPRRDARGRRYGFVRFCNVTDSRMLAIKLDSILIGSRKLHVNAPRFRRDWKDRNYKDQEVVKKKQEANAKLLEGQKKQKTITQQAGKSKVVKVWRRKENENEVSTRKEQVHKRWDRNVQVHTNPLPPRVVYHRKIDLSEICFMVPEDKMTKYNKTFVGVVKEPGSTYNIQEWFNINGVFSIKATPLGANKVLLEEEEEGTIQAMVAESEEWWREKFDDVRNWCIREVDNERIVWLRCHGIPPHAWCDEFFASLARKYGTLVGIDEATTRMSSLDVARICIRTRSYDVFNMVVVANINESLFNIKMIEEWCGPQVSYGSSVFEGFGDSVPNFKQVSLCSEESDEDGPGLFTVADGETVGEFMESPRCSVGEDERSVDLSVVNESPWLPEVERRNFEAAADDYVGCVSPTLSRVVESSLPIGCEINDSVAPQIVPQTVGNVASIDTVVIKGPFGGVFERGEPSKAWGCTKNKGVFMKKCKRKRKGKKQKEAQLNASKAVGPGSTVRANFQPIPDSPLLCGVSGAVRNPPSFVSLSSNASSGSVSLLKDHSVGDSGIQMGNARFVVNHDFKMAGKLWKIATDDLGVTGEEIEEVYIERIREMEAADKEGQGKKGKSTNKS